ASTQAFAPSPIISPVTAESMMVLPAPVGATPSVLPREASAATLRSTKVFWRGRRRIADPPSLRPAPPTGGAGGGRGLAGLGGCGGLLRGVALRRGGGDLRRDRAHHRGVIAVIGGDRGTDLVLVLAVGVGPDVDAGDEFDAVEITEPVDAAA